MIKHQEDKYSWTSLYIGTDISNTRDADRIGIERKFATTRAKMYKGYDTINSVVSCYRNTLGDAHTKGVAMFNALEAEITTNNAEYLADTGVKIDNG